MKQGRVVNDTAPLFTRNGINQRRGDVVILRDVAMEIPQISSISVLLGKPPFDLDLFGTREVTYGREADQYSVKASSG